MLLLTIATCSSLINLSRSLSNLTAARSLRTTLSRQPSFNFQLRSQTLRSLLKCRGQKAVLPDIESQDIIATTNVYSPMLTSLDGWWSRKKHIYWYRPNFQRTDATGGAHGRAQRNVTSPSGLLKLIHRQPKQITCYSLPQKMSLLYLKEGEHFKLWSQGLLSALITSSTYKNLLTQTEKKPKYSHEQEGSSRTSLQGSNEARTS